MDNREPLDKLITTTKRLEASTTVLLLREMYETQYGIFNHDAPGAAKAAPLALVAMHRKEDAYSYSMERHYLWKFRQYKLNEKWGLSLNDWLSLPFFMACDLLEIEQRIAMRENELLKAREAQMKQDQSKMDRSVGR